MTDIAKDLKFKYELSSLVIDYFDESKILVTMKNNESKDLLKVIMSDIEEKINDCLDKNYELKDRNPITEPKDENSDVSFEFVVK